MIKIVYLFSKFKENKDDLLNVPQQLSIHIFGHASEDISKANKECNIVSSFGCLLKHIALLFPKFATYGENGNNGDCSFKIDKAYDVMKYYTILLVELRKELQLLNQVEVQMMEI